jgi:hypothetical protein
MLVWDSVLFVWEGRDIPMVTNEEAAWCYVIFNMNN